MSKTFISSLYKRQLDWHSSNFFLNKMSWTRAEENLSSFLLRNDRLQVAETFSFLSCLRVAHEGTWNFLDAEISRTRWAISLIELTNERFSSMREFHWTALEGAPKPSSSALSLKENQKENFSANRSCSWMTSTTPENYGLIQFSRNVWIWLWEQTNCLPPFAPQTADQLLGESRKERTARSNGMCWGVRRN